MIMRYLLPLFICLFLSCTNKKQKTQADNADVYYTCSMDPQVVENKPGKCPICKMPLTPVKKSTVQHSDDLQLSDQQVQLANITVDTIRATDVGDETVLTAVLNFDQTKTTAISSKVMGRVEQLYFRNIGDYVQKGDRLFSIYSEELNNAKQEYLLALERRKTFTESDLVDFTALLQSARNKLKLWGLSDAQVADLERSGKANPTTTYYSTKNGFVTTLAINQGDYVMEGGTIVELADLSTLWAEAQVYTSLYTEFEPTSTATVHIPEAGNLVMKGKISFANPEVVPGARVSLIRVTIPNKGYRLKPGMAASVQLTTGARSTLTLPIDAVIRDAKGATVWVRTGNNTFRNKMVTVGTEMNDRIEIRSGLQPGDMIVMTGAYLLNSEYIFKRGSNPMEGHKM
jgi:membrane fusion protein, copper/silver efflux system